jgi:hypothetical protein
MSQNVSVRENRTSGLSPMTGRVFDEIERRF